MVLPWASLAARLVFWLPAKGCPGSVKVRPSMRTSWLWYFCRVAELLSAISGSVMRTVSTLEGSGTPLICILASKSALSMNVIEGAPLYVPSAPSCIRPL